MEALSRLPVDNVVFPKLGIDLTINSEAISIFGFSVKWYGVMIALGMLLAMMYCFRRAKEYGIDGDRLIDAVIAGVIGAVVGARLYYVVLHSASYHSIKDILSIRDGGLAIYGGIIGGLTSGMPIIFRAAFKPTPSIGLPQRSVDLDSLEETRLEIRGRHDPCIAVRAVPCVEAAAAVTVLDMVLGK